MTKENVILMRDMYDKLGIPYNLWSDGSRTLPSKGDICKLIYDDDHELVHCIRPSTNYYRNEPSVNMTTIDYSIIFCFDSDMKISEAKKILEQFVSDGLVSQEDAEKFIELNKQSYEFGMSINKNINKK